MDEQANANRAQPGDSPAGIGRNAGQSAIAVLEERAGDFTRVTLRD